MRSSALKTHIPENLKGCQKISYCTYRKYRPSCHKVESLLALCEPVTESINEPYFWFLTVEDVAELVVNNMGHPELKETFIKNCIDGKALIFLEADKFPRMNIKYFDLIKELTSEIRKLCKIDQDDFKRSISLPFRRPEVLYFWYKAKRSGPTSFFMTPVKYFKKIQIIRDETTENQRYYELLNHWNRIPPFRPWNPHVLIGGIKRINPMTGTTQKEKLFSNEGPFILKDLCFYHVSNEERKKLRMHCKRRFGFRTKSSTDL